MSNQFSYKNINELTFIVDGIEFPYRECEIMAERISKILPVTNLVLKNNQGFYADIEIHYKTHSESDKHNIISGTYTAALYTQSDADFLDKITNFFS